MAEKITGKGTQSRVGSSNTGGRMSIRTGESGFDSAWHRLPKEIKYPVIGLFAT